VAGSCEQDDEPSGSVNFNSCTTGGFSVMAVPWS
jgi:hypothetical protein